MNNIEPAAAAICCKGVLAFYLKIGTNLITDKYGTRSHHCFLAKCHIKGERSP